MDIRCADLADHQLIPHFLMASYLYYHHEQSLMADTEFDALCDRMRAAWDRLEHRHKWLIQPEDLAAGTGYAIREAAYPTIVKTAAWQLLDVVEGRRPPGPPASVAEVPVLRKRNIKKRP